MKSWKKPQTEEKLDTKTRETSSSTEQRHNNFIKEKPPPVRSRLVKTVKSSPDSGTKHVKETLDHNRLETFNNKKMKVRFFLLGTLSLTH